MYEFAGSNVQVRSNIYTMDYSGRFLSSPPIAAVSLLVSLARPLRPLLSAFEYLFTSASNVSERGQLFEGTFRKKKKKREKKRKESVQRQHEQGMHRAVARFIQTIHRTLRVQCAPPQPFLNLSTELICPKTQFWLRHVLDLATYS